MYQNPPPKSQQAGWPAAGEKLDNANNFIQSAPPQGPTPAESESPKLWHSLQQSADQAV
jgi:hypothetical protein